MLRLVRAMFLRDDHAGASLADSVRESGERVPSLSQQVSASSSAGLLRLRVASESRVSPTRMQRVVELVALIWLLILGQVSMARDVGEPEVARARIDLDPARTVDGVAPECHTRVAQSEHGSRQRPLKRHHVSAKIALLHSPDSDDETSEDSDDDDDTSNDVNDNDDDTDLPIVFWLQDMVRYLIAVEAESALPWTESPSSPFPTLQRLRC
jgi:hypothetical protein